MGAAPVFARARVGVLFKGGLGASVAHRAGAFSPVTGMSCMGTGGLVLGCV